LGENNMSSYLPVIISGVLIIAILLWWLLALDGIKKSGDATKDVAPPPAPPAAVPAPPVAPAAKVATPPKLMDDPTPAAKTAKATVQAPLKAAATQKAPAAKPAPAKAAAPKAAAPKAVAPKVAAPKPAAPKAVAPKTAAPKAVVAKAAAPKVKVAKPAAKVSIPDNLELLKGVGPKVNNMLKGLGITSFAQVASWTPADVAEIDGKLGAFAGRISRDNWIDQAQLLVAGDVAAFEKKYGALGSEVKG
jgi:predicted flap endonuclease-1-like 5' DNA nuclease